METRKTVRSIGEVGIINRIRRRLRPSASVMVGIGDDAAVLKGPRGKLLLFASDMIVEGVHFQRELVPARWIGWKALACNVSDVAAMGGVPQWAVVSLGVPQSTPVRFIDELAVGLQRCARRFDMAIVGGDTVRAPQVVIDVAILGAVAAKRLVRRNGAKVGDLLYVTGRLGGSYRTGKHARFIPRVREAQELLRHVRIHAMMDLSDGLASDLWQMSRASRVTLRIEAKRIPMSPEAGGLYQALMDGEDFELLFAVAPRDAGRIPRRLGRVPVTCVGYAMTRGVNVELEDAAGRIQRLLPQGFKHF